MKLTREFLQSFGAAWDGLSAEYSLRLPSHGVRLTLSPPTPNGRWTVVVTKTGLGDPVRVYNDVETVEEMMGCVFAAGFDIGKEHLRDALWCLLKPSDA